MYFFLDYVNFLFFFFMHCAYFALYTYYLNFWHVLYPLGYGPMYLDWMNKKVSKQAMGLNYAIHWLGHKYSSKAFVSLNI